jgi:hypothetical protein
MSGGSYDYLCYAFDLDALLGKRRALEQMADRLEGLGYAQDAAKETRQLIHMLNQAESKIMACVDRLADVWKAVEWWDSCDSSEDDLKEALKEYREKKKARA